MEIYANPRAWRVRIAQAAVWIVGAAILWLILFSGEAPQSQADLYAAWICAPLAAAAIVAMAVYPYCYVVRLRVRGGLEITTLSLFGQRTFNVNPALVALGALRNDRLAARTFVNNFWRPLRVPGEMFPLIVDTTAAYVNEWRLEQAKKNAQKPAKRRPSRRGVKGR